MSTFGYQRELKKYEEVDEEELLATLSSEELQELERELADLDPDDNVPIGLRQKDQTARSPTGNFDRDALLKYWEDENKKLLEDVKDTKSEQLFGRRRHAPEKIEGRMDNSRMERLKVNSSDACRNPDDRRKVSEKAKKSVLSKKEAKADESEKKDECKEETPTKRKCPKGSGGGPRSDCDLCVTSEGASGNPTVIEDALQKILSDDPNTSEVNLNNIEDISQETLLRFAEALRTNTHVRVFSLANTRADDRVAFAVSKMLCENSSVRNLNIESNFVSGQGILALLAALIHNRTLVELRFHNQRHICGGKVEMEMVKLLRENTTLLKLGYQFDLPGPRMTATSILTRNQDQQRQRRLQQKKEQGPAEVATQPPPPPTADKRPPKKSSQSSKTVSNRNRNPLPAPSPSPDPPTRKIGEMVKQHEGSNGPKAPTNQRKPKSKKLKNGANEKESVDILKELKNALRPSLQKRRDEPTRLPPPQRSSRDDLMAAIRGSSIGSLKRVDLSQT